MSIEKIKKALTDGGLFQTPGAYVLVDGQFGSTGKGLAASVLAECFHKDVTQVLTNAGPNSGHTSYFGDEKIVLRQLPTFSVVAKKHGSRVSTFMNAGAIIDIKLLEAEQNRYMADGGFLVWVHPRAAVVDDGAKKMEADMTSRIGSTGKGTGAALSNKIMRLPEAVFSGHMRDNNLLMGRAVVHEDDVVFIEVSQGFSLGLNQNFYPYCTSRECTVGAAMSDAELHPSLYRQSMMVVRTFPIRVAGNSGPGYDDQSETTWEAIGQAPEYTTVTNKVRRVFTWSRRQYMDALVANQPEYIFLNFCNYLPPDSVDDFVRDKIIQGYREALGRSPKAVLLGYGPKNDDVKLWEGVR